MWWDSDESNIKAIGVALLLFCFIAIEACEKQKMLWQGVTEEEINDVKDGMLPELKLSISKYHPPYGQFLADSEGRIFVRTNELIEGGEGYYYDVFDAKGKYVVKIPLKSMPRVLKNSQFYTIELDEEGYQVIKRYKVIWNLNE